MEITPGKWINKDETILSTDGRCIAALGLFRFTETERNANKALIAAAPALYRALEMVLGQIEDSIDLARAEAALALARGESNG